MIKLFTKYTIITFSLCILMVLTILLFHSSLAAFWKNLPDVAKAATLTASVVLFGSCIQVFTSIFVMERRIVFEGNDKRAERELTLKKELYVKIMEDYADMSTNIVSIANPAIPLTQIAQTMNKPFVNLLKVELIASDSTINHLRELKKYYLTRFIEYVPKRKILDDITHEISLLNQKIDFGYEQREIILDELKQSQVSKERLQLLNDEFLKYGNLLDEHKENIIAEKNASSNEQFKLLELLTKDIFELEKLLGNLKETIRAELNLNKFDSSTKLEDENYNKYMRDQINKLSALLNPKTVENNL